VPNIMGRLKLVNIDTVDGQDQPCPVRHVVMDRKLFIKIMDEIAGKSLLTWDGINNFLTYDDDSIFIFVSDISGEMYSALKRDTHIHTKKGPGYEVFAKINCDSFEQGTNMGKNGDAVRIRILVLVTDPCRASENTEEMKKDALALFAHFRAWDNMEKHLHRSLKSAA